MRTIGLGADFIGRIRRVPDLLNGMLKSNNFYSENASVKFVGNYVFKCLRFYARVGGR